MSISIHAAREGGDKYQSVQAATALISIHAAREGGDNAPALAGRAHRIFQSTPPVKAATSDFCRPSKSFVFQSTPPVKAATPEMQVITARVSISIHAAREGGDRSVIRYGGRTIISIHAAREGGDALDYLPIVDIRHFNPRRP